MKKQFAHNKFKPEPIAVKSVIASLMDQARDKTDFVDRKDPEDIFSLDIRMLHEASRLQIGRASCRERV